MKSTIVFSLVAIAVIISACNSSSDKTQMKSESSSKGAVTTVQTYNLDTTKLKSGDTFYQCEMDLEVLSDKPGNCPKCSMELTVMKKH